MAQGVEICAVSWHIIPKIKIRNQKYVGVYAHVGVYDSTDTVSDHMFYFVWVWIREIGHLFVRC